jgi:hypothetical protein
VGHHGLVSTLMLLCIFLDLFFDFSLVVQNRLYYVRVLPVLLPLDVLTVSFEIENAKIFAVSSTGEKIAVRSLMGSHQDLFQDQFVNKKRGRKIGRLRETDNRLLIKKQKVASPPQPTTIMTELMQARTELV